MINDQIKESIAIEVIKILHNSAEYIQENVITKDENPFYASFYKGIISNVSKTMEQILEIINAIATLEFIDKYNYLNESANRLNETEYYNNLLQKWFLFSEIELLNNNAIILQKVRDNKKATRILNQPVFKDGGYNSNRYDFLKQVISN
jgi:hypothetical protein